MRNYGTAHLRVRRGEVRIAEMSAAEFAAWLGRPGNRRIIEAIKARDAMIEAKARGDD